MLSKRSRLASDPITLTFTARAGGPMMTGRQLMDPVCWPSRLLSMALKRCGSRSAQPPTPTPGANPPLVAPGSPRGTRWRWDPARGRSIPWWDAPTQSTPWGNPTARCPPPAASPSPPLHPPQLPVILSRGVTCSVSVFFHPKLSFMARVGSRSCRRVLQGSGVGGVGSALARVGAGKIQIVVLKALPFFNIFLKKKKSQILAKITGQSPSVGTWGGGGTGWAPPVFLGQLGVGFSLPNPIPAWVSSCPRATLPALSLRRVGWFSHYLLDFLPGPKRNSLKCLGVHAV